LIRLRCREELKVDLGEGAVSEGGIRQGEWDNGSKVRQCNPGFCTIEGLFGKSIFSGIASLQDLPGKFFAVGFSCLLFIFFVFWIKPLTNRLQ
jgi:hypothetical protein